MWYTNVYACTMYKKRTSILKFLLALTFFVFLFPPQELIPLPLVHVHCITCTDLLA